MKVIEFDGARKFKFKAEDTDTNAVRIRELEWLANYIPDWGLNLEFGVHSGLTISQVATARPELDFHGFDSFEGLPEDWDMGQKVVSKEAFDVKGVMPEVPDNVKLHKGWFEETLEPFLEENDSPVSYLHIDCDLYSSTSYVLDTLNKHIVPGTVIRFDELVCWRHALSEASPMNKAYRVLYTTWKDHEWKALNEWLEKYERTVVPISRNWFQGGTVVVTK